MRVSSFAVARPVYYDRNATTTTSGYFNNPGPHGSTTRFTITNTASQKMFVDSGVVTVYRDTVATIAGSAAGALQSPGGSSVLLTFQYSNTVGNIAQQVLAGSIYIKPGDSLIGITFDNSTGGTIQYALFAHAVQFDA